jgi:hypothetical protein
MWPGPGRRGVALAVAASELDGGMEVQAAGAVGGRVETGVARHTGKAEKPPLRVMLGHTTVDRDACARRAVGHCEVNRAPSVESGRVQEREVVWRPRVWTTWALGRTTNLDANLAADLVDDLADASRALEPQRARLAHARQRDPKVERAQWQVIHSIEVGTDGRVGGRGRLHAQRREGRVVQPVTLLPLERVARRHVRRHHIEHHRLVGLQERRCDCRIGQRA